jgi:serine/threonine-protein kinase RsbT
MNFQYRIAGGDFARAGSASSEVKKLLKQLNLEPRIIKKIAVAMYEAEVNVVAHAYQGIMNVTIEDNKIIVNVTDEGPGIADIEKAMTEGYSTASPIVREMGFGAGMGLSNMKRNSDILDIKSKEGKGTSVTITCFINNGK